jgi:hypothetical protein
MIDEPLRAELLERADRDQTARRSVPPRHTSAQWERIVAPVDADNTARLRQIIDDHGWPGAGLVGQDGAHAAWLIAQHSVPDLQELWLPLLEAAAACHDASRTDLAYLTDRVLMHRGDPQRYGTQYTYSEGELTLWPVESPEDLDERRAELGLEPEAQNRARILASYEPGPSPAAGQPSAT